MDRVLRERAAWARDVFSPISTTAFQFVLFGRSRGRHDTRYRAADRECKTRRDEEASAVNEYVPHYSGLSAKWGCGLLRALIVLIAINIAGVARAEDAPRQASTPVTTDASPEAVATVPPTPVAAPVWQVGDAWRYSYKSPSGSGTYVWSVNRIESLDGIPHYVIKSGTREILYRVSDLASSLERVDGVVVSRESPSRLSYVWPLTIGKTWEQSTVRERPVDRQTLSRDSLYTVEDEETITVPAGTFRTLKIVWRNKRTRALIDEMWYAPDVKLWVKIREVLENGVRERELLNFKLKQTLSTPPVAERDVVVASTANAPSPAKPTNRRLLTKVSGTEPTFPRAAIAAGIENGRVASRLQIDETGNVYEVTIVTADPPGYFDQAVIEALREWKFQGDGNRYVSEVEIKFEHVPARSPDGLTVTNLAAMNEQEHGESKSVVAAVGASPPTFASAGIRPNTALEVGRVTLRISDDGWENVGAGRGSTPFTGDRSGDIQYETAHLLLRSNTGEFRAALAVRASRGVPSVFFTWNTKCEAKPNVHAVDGAAGNFRGVDCLLVSGPTRTQGFLKAAEPELLSELTAHRIVLPDTAYVVIHEKAIESGAFILVRIVFAADFNLPSAARTQSDLPAGVKPDTVAWGLRLVEAVRSSMYSLSGALVIPPVTAKVN
jgi:protein TonB